MASWAFWMDPPVVTMSSTRSTRQPSPTFAPSTSLLVPRPLGSLRTTNHSLPARTEITWANWSAPMVRPPTASNSTSPKFSRIASHATFRSAPRRRPPASIRTPPARTNAPAAATSRLTFSPVNASGGLLNDSPSTCVGIVVVVSTLGPAVGAGPGNVVDVEVVDVEVVEVVDVEVVEVGDVVDVVLGDVVDGVL